MDARRDVQQRSKKEMKGSWPKKGKSNEDVLAWVRRNGVLHNQINCSLHLQIEFQDPKSFRYKLSMQSGTVSKNKILLLKNSANEQKIFSRKILYIC